MPPDEPRQSLPDRPDAQKYANTPAGDMAREIDRLRAENVWLRNQMGDVRGMQSDGATPEEMDRALGRALSGERARLAFDAARAALASDEQEATP